VEEEDRGMDIKGGDVTLELLMFVFSCHIMDYGEAHMWRYVCLFACCKNFVLKLVFFCFFFLLRHCDVMMSSPKLGLLLLLSP